MFICLICVLFAGGCSGSYNLFIAENEMDRLFGVTGEFYIVRDGVINENALSFVMPISSSVIEIEFSWFSTDSDLNYNISFDARDKNLLLKPVTSIASSGTIPSLLRKFTVRLPCTGTEAGSGYVHIYLDISTPESNATRLDIIREKHCELAFSGGSLLRLPGYEVLSSSDTNYTEFEDAPSGSPPRTSASIFYISVGGACAFILLVAFCVAFYYIRTQKSDPKPSSSDALDRPIVSSQNEPLTSPVGAPSGTTYMRAETPTSSVSGFSIPPIEMLRRAYSIQGEARGIDVHSVLQDIAVDRAQITLGNLLLEGTFGRVYSGSIRFDDEETGEIDEQQIFIKTVTSEARKDQIDRLLFEGCLLKDWNYDHLNPIIGSCLDDSEQPMLLYPHANQGNLKKFLLRCKISDVGTHHTLNTQQLVYMAIQIIKGIQYLHRRKFIHKDVATRNCVVTSHLIVRLADNALSRDLFPNDYHCLGDNENRPIKWLSIEALVDARFAVASDVWSFGVCLWELMTLGQQPYPDIDAFEMGDYLSEGYRMSQPVNCPDELFAVMAACWAMSPEDRPKFSQLMNCLTDFYAALGRYI